MATELSQRLATKPGYQAPYDDPFVETAVGSGLYQLDDAALLTETSAGTGLYVEA